MAGSKEAATLAEHIVHGNAVPSTISTTPAGQVDDAGRKNRIEAINQVFALFRLNYHNQYYAAYPDVEQVNHIKRLWLDALGDYEPDTILRGARHAIENSSYLPTLKLMLECCQEALSDAGLPKPREAYLEACSKPSPKLEQHWSHPAVYFAGRDSDWFFLANQSERTTWPVFEQHYQRYRLRVSKGEKLCLPEREELPPPNTDTMSMEQRKWALKALRADLGL
jgi:hypothetical protein